jgi:hypothetical protein
LPLDYLLLIRFAMEKVEQKYIMCYEDGRKVIVSAQSLEDAIERFKELRIDTESKEIIVMSAQEMYNQHKKM